MICRFTITSTEESLTITKNCCLDRVVSYTNRHNDSMAFLNLIELIFWDQDPCVSCLENADEVLKLLIEKVKANKEVTCSDTYDRTNTCGRTGKPRVLLKKFACCGAFNNMLTHGQKSKALMLFEHFECSTTLESFCHQKNIKGVEVAFDVFRTYTALHGPLLPGRAKISLLDYTFGNCVERCHGRGPLSQEIIDKFIANHDLFNASDVLNTCYKYNFTDTMMKIMEDPIVRRGDKRIDLNSVLIGNNISLLAEVIERHPWVDLSTHGKLLPTFEFSMKVTLVNAKKLNSKHFPVNLFPEQPSMTFWNRGARIFARDLWKPPLDLPNYESQREYFKCNNKNISFTYSYQTDLMETPRLNFLPVPVIDNTEKKNILRESLTNTEDVRYAVALAAPDLDAAQRRELRIAHEKIVAKNEIKVNNLDLFIRTRRTRLNLNKNQINTLRDWFLSATYVYNDLVEEFNRIYRYMHKEAARADKLQNGECVSRQDKVRIAKTAVRFMENGKINADFPVTFIKLRDKKMEDLDRKYPGMPAHVLADVIKDFVTSIKSNFTKIKDGNQHHFEFKYRDPDRDYQVLSIQHSDTGRGGFYARYMGEISVKNATFSWENVHHDYKLIYDTRINHFYVHVPGYFPPKPRNVFKHPVASMDPGSRTFQTLYGLNHVIEIGENMNEIIMRRLKRIDRLRALLVDNNQYNRGRKRYQKNRSYKKRIRREELKIHNLRDELHYKTSNYLCTHYERIITTDFSSRKVNSKYGPLNAETKRVLGVLSHSKFKLRLKEKCDEYGCHYLECSEAYTSKTCGGCGNQKDNLGGNKVYNCKECKLIIGRDVNAARNILIKNRGEVIDV